MIMHLEQEAPLERESSITKSDNGDFNNSKYCLVTLFVQNKSVLTILYIK